MIVKHKPRLLTVAQVEEIKTRVFDAEAPASVAKCYGISESTVRRVRDGKYFMKQVPSKDRQHKLAISYPLTQSH